MKNWRKITISPETPILKAVEIIDMTGRQIALVVDGHDRLLGIVTDADVRRGLLKGISVDQPASRIMNPKPVLAGKNDSPAQILAMMKRRWLPQIPVVDENGMVLRVEILDELLQAQNRENVVFLLAGGLGTRLGTLTNDCPKPLLRIGDKPILEQIVLNFIEQGFRRFVISLHYKAEMIREHFGNGSKWGVDVTYVEEERPLGTAGALGLLPEPPTTPVLVMNGDLVTKINFDQLLQFHQESMAEATLCARPYEFQIPYGVVRVENQLLAGIEEKPQQNFLVNAGIYILNPSVVQRVPRNEFLNMTTLFQQLIQECRKTSVFPLREYWLDIGRPEDFKKANEDHGTSGETRG